jgi:Bacteriophage Lambda NinG protein
MKRGAPMKRTPMTRKAPLRVTPNTAHTEVRPKKCKACRSPFFPASAWQTHCRAEPCALAALAEATRKRQKQEAKAKADEAKQDKARREALKSISKLESECRDIVQELARIRDRKHGCISCHMGPTYDGQWHGSHYRAHGGCSSLQMHLWNIHKACAQCNLFKGGNKDGFIRGLLAKPGYGRERLEWLDCQPKSKRLTREYLGRFKAVMGKRLRRARAAAKKECGQ